ncbi:COMM domain [Balamuthia mandrillaris]
MTEETARLVFAADKLKHLRHVGFVDEVMDIEEFLHLVIDELCGRPCDWQQHFQEKTEQYKLIVKSCLAFCRRAVGAELDRDTILAELEENEVPEEHMDVIADCILLRTHQIREALGRDITKISKKYLKDFDWKLQLALSSDKISVSRESILRLSLSLKGASGTDDEEVLLELSREDLDKLIASLQQASSAATALFTYSKDAPQPQQQ